MSKQWLRGFVRGLLAFVLFTALVGAIIAVHAAASSRGSGVGYLCWSGHQDSVCSSVQAERIIKQVTALH